MGRHDRRIHRLLDVAGTTYAEQAGIRLADRPAPLYQLLVLASLLSTRISAHVAVAAARELRAAGCTTPQKMRAATWQQRVDALGRGHYRRYDESTATRLGEGAQLLIERYRGDLRRLADSRAIERSGKIDTVSARLREVPGIGPVGVDIFLREVQAAWPWVRPYAGVRVADAAKQLGLPSTARGLARAAGTDDLARLTAAIVRGWLDKDVRAQL